MIISALDKIIYDYLALYAGCTCIHRFENTQRANLPYLSWFVESIKTIGQDFTDLKTNSSGNFNIYSNKEAYVYIQAFGATSEDILNNIILTRYDSNVQTYLLSKSCIISEFTDVKTMPELIGNGYEKRSDCQMTIKYCDTKQINVSYIDSSKINLKIKEQSTTIYNENITIGG